MTDSGAKRAAAASAGSQPKLARRIGLASLVVYGVGDMVGAGIYGTIGVAAAALGNAVWLAFVGSMTAAMLTGLSYASLASRMPRAGGAAHIVYRAYRLKWLAYIVGLAVVASGLTSMATSSNVFASTLATFLDGIPLLGAMPPWMLMLGFIGVIALINFIGIRESIWANWVCTIIEVGGLVFIVLVGMRYWGSVDYLETPAAAEDALFSGLDISLLASGAVLTFFAFIGFEDMLNVAEEVKQPERTMPLGIVLALSITAILYIAVAITAVSVVHYTDLGNVELGAPLQQITARAAPWLPVWVFGFITLFAVANTVLINYIMGSRLLYGMARDRLVPSVLGRVHAKTRTPHIAILVLLLIVMALALTGGIAELASATSLLLLSVFVIVNVALLVLQRRPDEPAGRFEVPAVVPVLGALVCVGLIGSRVARVITDPAESAMPLLIAGLLLVGIGLLYVTQRPARIPDQAGSSV